MKSAVPRLPPSHPDQVTHNRRLAETVNNILGFQHDDSRIQTAAEASAGVTPVNYSYAPGHLQRYGCDVTGGTDNSTQIANAINAAVASGGTGFIYHPGGTILHNTTITLPTGITVRGFDRNACIFSYSGLGDGWRFQKPVNGSGYALINFEKVKLACTNANNNGAAIELNAGGWSYFHIHDCWLQGKWNGGIWIDACEILTFNDNLVDLAGNALGSQTGIWIINGPDRNPGQSQGFTNIIRIRDNQISLDHGNPIVDDGGSVHIFEGNNINQGDSPVRIAGVDSLVWLGNSIETTNQIGSYNMQLTNTSKFGAATVGPCVNGIIMASAFYGSMLSGTMLQFAGAMHTGFTITSNEFGNRLGRDGAIDVTKLGNSACKNNKDFGQAGMHHYIGVHNDPDGNELGLPQNGYTVTANINGPTFGDTRAAYIQDSGMQLGASGTAIGTKIKGTTNFPTTTAVTVNVGTTLPSSTFQVTLAQSATSTSPPWVTAKSTTGFTINFSANFTGNVDWILEQ